MKKLVRFIPLFLLIGVLAFGIVLKREKSSNSLPVPTLTPTPSPTPTPTPKPLTFSEMNSLYGPCVYAPTLMYHHVQGKEAAKGKNQTALTVNTSEFRAQMQYLRAKGYTIVGVESLINFFDQGIPLPKKSVLITFDDAYLDIYADAYPVLREFNYPATVFVPTGLVGGADYLSWDKIGEMKGGNIFFGNHTWSHKNVKAKDKDFKTEIQTADIQLNERGVNSPKIFAYPYGTESSEAISFLQSLDYKVAFTTRAGGVLCKKQRYSLPRIRIGNGSLSNYGL